MEHAAEFGAAAASDAANDALYTLLTWRTPVTLASEAPELHRAVARGRVKDTRDLIQAARRRGMTGEALQTWLSAANGYGQTALMTAAAVADDGLAGELMAALLSAGAPVDARDGLGFSALHWAATVGGSGKRIEQLVAAGGLPSCVSLNGDTPLHRAARCGRLAAMLALLRCSARPDARNNDGLTPYDVAGVLDEGLRKADVAGQVRCLLLQCVPSQRLGIFFHADCLHHGAKTDHQEAADRVEAIMRRIDTTCLPPSDPDGTFESLPPAPAPTLPVFARRLFTTDAEVPPASPEAVLRVHSKPYWELVQAMHAHIHRHRKHAVLPFTPAVKRAVHGRGDLTPDRLAEAKSETVFNAGTLPAALRAAGAVCAAVDAVLAGQVRNAFCCVRPPGHHAGVDGICADSLASHDTCGFCVLNSVAVGCMHALATHGPRVRRVAIIDLDVHAGNGTEEIVRRWASRRHAGMEAARTTASPMPPEADQSILFFSVHLHDIERRRSALGGVADDGDAASAVGSMLSPERAVGGYRAASPAARAGAPRAGAVVSPAGVCEDDAAAPAQVGRKRGRANSMTDPVVPHPVGLLATASATALRSAAMPLNLGAAEGAAARVHSDPSSAAAGEGAAPTDAHVRLTQSVPPQAMGAHGAALTAVVGLGGGGGAEDEESDHSKARSRSRSRHGHGGGGGSAGADGDGDDAVMAPAHAVGADSTPASAPATSSGAVGTGRSRRSNAGRHRVSDEWEVGTAAVSAAVAAAAPDNHRAPAGKRARKGSFAAPADASPSAPPPPPPPPASASHLVALAGTAASPAGGGAPADGVSARSPVTTSGTRRVKLRMGATGSGAASPAAPAPSSAVPGAGSVASPPPVPPPPPPAADAGPTRVSVTPPAPPPTLDGCAGEVQQDGKAPAATLGQRSVGWAPAMPTTPPVSVVTSAHPTSTSAVPSSVDDGRGSRGSSSGERGSGGSSADHRMSVAALDPIAHLTDAGISLTPRHTLAAPMVGLRRAASAPSMPTPRHALFHSLGHGGAGTGGGGAGGAVGGGGGAGGGGMSLLSPRQLHTLQRLTSETVDGAHGHSSGVLQPSPTAFSLAAAVIGSAAPQPSPPDSFPVRGLGETLRSALRTGMVRSVSLPLQAGDDADMGHELHWRPVPILPPMAAAAAGAGAGVVAAVGVGGVRPDEAPAGKPPSAAAPPLTTWTTVAPVPVPAPATGAHGAAVTSTATSVPPLSIGMSVVVAGAAQHDVGASVEAGASEHRRSPAMPRHLPPLQVPQSSPLLPSRSSDSGAGGGLQWTGPLTDAARAIIAHAGMDPAAFQAQVAVGADATSASGGGGLEGAGSLLSPLRTSSFPNPSPGTPGVATFALPAPPSAEGDSDEDADIAYSFYPGTGESDVPFANIINAPIPPLWRERREARSKGVNKDASRATLGRLAFRRAITERLMPALRAFSPDVILVSAGFDAGAHDIGNQRGTTRDLLQGSNLTPQDFADITGCVLEVARLCCPGRVVSVLEGGYGSWRWEDVPVAPEADGGGSAGSAAASAAATKRGKGGSRTARNGKRGDAGGRGGAVPVPLRRAVRYRETLADNVMAHLIALVEGEANSVDGWLRGAGLAADDAAGGVEAGAGAVAAASFA